MEKKEEIKESLQEDQNEQCPKCGRELVVKWGRNGRFVACTGYPKCKYTKPLEIDIIETDEKCIHCGSKLTVRNGRYGRFLACSNYPECKYTKPYSMGIHCPEDKCDGQIVERKSRRGKTFFGCSNYPACHFATWYRPISVQCQKCGNLYMEEKSTKAKGHHLQCPKCKNIIHKEESLGSMENQ
ncbi:topoisomerase DNA-binding C4 zinc finger domain-containing protein [bacterium]|nr:topoisomerase DNA-binding C4 zinc finger domain-containing protein [bacterium]